MATTVRRENGAGKEKKGISPSTSTTRKTIRPSTSSISSSHAEKGTTISSSTTRQASSLVRPTRTTPNESSRLSKKPITEPSMAKLAPPRRRSFDHPTPPSHLQKAIRDAKNSRSASTFKNTMKSASPSSRPTSSDGPVKMEFGSLSMSPSVKKNAVSNTTTTSRRGPSKETSLIKKATRRSMPESNLHGIGFDLDDPFAIIEDELVNLDDADVQSLPEISEMPIFGGDLGDPETLENVVKQPVEEEDDKKPNFEDGHEQEEDSSVAYEPTTQDTTTSDDIQIEEKQLENQNNVEEQNQIEEDIDDHQGVVDLEVVATDEPKETLSEAKKEDVSLMKEEEEEEEKTEGIKIETNTENESIDEETSRKSTVANVVSRSQFMDKKENQQAYNDVIEQTATKLRSKKNKVLALAGAFETVISLQEKN